MENTLKDEDRREHKRVSCQIELHCTVMAAVPYEYGEAYAIDISEGGACFFGRHPVSPPVTLQIEVRTPTPPYHFLLIAKALRCKQCEDTDLYEINIHFTCGVPKDFKKKIETKIWKEHWQEQRINLSR